MPEAIPYALADKIDQCLPQTQCTLCDYPRCREYAEAIARDEAGINQCPPGGDTTINLLGDLLQQSKPALDTSHGINEPKLLAKIVEAQCIGCKLCIKACPVDCIIGAPKKMHTVLANECTGCKLCLPVCPTDCIVMVSPGEAYGVDQRPSPWPGFSREQVDQARINTEAKLERTRAREKRRSESRRILRRQQMQKEILRAVSRKTGKSHDAK
jgi:electron transport complex protein RnfB